MLLRIRALWRLGRSLLHLLAGFLTIVFRFPRLSSEQKQQCVQVWSLKLLACLAIQLEVLGQPGKTGPLLLVANHLSWLDITALHAARFCRFVSKADVQRWPLIGFLAAGNGTLFIERASRRDAKRMVAHMAQSLRAGDVLAVFPEGTTGDGKALLPFHGNLLQAAIEAAAPVQPVALRYQEGRSGAISSAPLYTGGDTLLASVWRTLCAPEITVVVHFGPLQYAGGRERRAWAVDLRREVEALSSAQK